MFCTNCGVELREDDVFCAKCGTRMRGQGPVAQPRPLLLDKRNKKLAGVCAGFARYFDMDVVLLRVLWLVIAFSTGIGFIAYLVAWVVIPSDYGQTVPMPAAARPPIGRTEASDPSFHTL